MRQEYTKLSIEELNYCTIPPSPKKGDFREGRVDSELTIHSEQFTYCILWVNRCFSRGNGCHFWNPGVIGYASRYQDVHLPNSAIFFIIASIVHGSRAMNTTNWCKIDSCFQRRQDFPSRKFFHTYCTRYYTAKRTVASAYRDYKL
jgi:hypothetical protein